MLLAEVVPWHHLFIPCFKMKDTYKNILVIVSGFLVIASFFLYKEATFKGQVFLALGLVIGIASLMFPVLAEWIVIGWYKLSEILGWVSSRVLLSTIFYFFLTPIALLSRLFNKDPLLLNKKEGSLYYERNHKYQPKDLKFPW